MSAVAALLVLVSCVLHAGWNLWVRRARDTTAFTCLALASGVVVFLPAFVFCARSVTISAPGWLCVLGTGLAYFGYYRGVARAYQSGELSTTYPLMRGVGPVCALAGGILFLGERPSWAGAAGVILIVAAMFALLGGVSRDALRRPATRAALFVGLMYGAYSLIDKAAVGQFRVPPFVYLYLTYAVGASLFFIWFARFGDRNALRREWRERRFFCIAVGLCDPLTYLLVLTALALPESPPVGYVAALRTLSVPLGVLLGVRTLGEGRASVKLAASVLLIFGLILIAWKG